MFYDYPVLNAPWSFSLAEESELFGKEREPGKEGSNEERLNEEHLKEAEMDPASKKLLSRLRKDPEAYEQFLDLPPRLQE